jgi:hypothetical protein
MPIHYVNVDPISALRLYRLNFRTKIGKVSGKNRGCNLDGTIKSHLASPLAAGFGKGLARCNGRVTTRFIIVAARIKNLC